MQRKACLPFFEEDKGVCTEDGLEVASLASDTSCHEQEDSLCEVKWLSTRKEEGNRLQCLGI